MKIPVAGHNKSEVTYMKKMDLLSEAVAEEEYLRYCRRSLHAIAERGFDTEKTLRFVSGELEHMGIKAEKCGRAGLTALIGNGEAGCILLRADMDALPLGEETGLGFASKNGGFHGCGHDMHTAMLLGAAKLLKKHERELNRGVKLMFQSAEEILEGAKDMMEAGVLDSPKVEAAVMIHALTALELPAGSIIVPEAGVSAPAADYFTIELRGQGCHGSSPNTGVDPISAAAHILVGLQELSARELAMNERAMLSIGSIHGGDAPNVIPEKVLMQGTLRAMEEDTRKYIKRRLEEIARGIAAAFRTEASVSFDRGCPGFMNDGKLRNWVKLRAEDILGKERVFPSGELEKAGGRGSRTAGSEDFAYISREVPSLMLALAAGEPKNGFVHPLHHPKADFDETALPYGAAVLACCGAEWGMDA